MGSLRGRPGTSILPDCSRVGRSLLRLYFSFALSCCFVIGNLLNCPREKLILRDSSFQNSLLFHSCVSCFAHSSQDIQARLVRFAPRLSFLSQTHLSLHVAPHKLSQASISQVFNRYLTSQYFST